LLFKSEDLTHLILVDLMNELDSLSFCYYKVVGFVFVGVWCWFGRNNVNFEMRTDIVTRFVEIAKE